MNPERLIFVYNADNGFFNAVIDWSHKFYSPHTYQCSLCRFTFGLVGMRMPWKDYLETLPFPVTFLHRAEFREQFPAHAQLPLPVILAEQSPRMEILLSADDINAAGGLAGLIGLMQLRLEELPKRATSQTAALNRLAENVAAQR